MRRRRIFHVDLSKKRKEIRSVVYNYKINMRPLSIRDDAFGTLFMCGGEYIILSQRTGVPERYQTEYLRLKPIKYLKPYGAKVYVRSIYDKPFTKKARQARMGKGKGKIKHLIRRVDENDALSETRKPNELEIRALQRSGVDVQELTRASLCEIIRRIQYKSPLPLCLYPYQYPSVHNGAIELSADRNADQTEYLVDPVANIEHSETDTSHRRIDTSSIQRDLSISE